MFKICGIKCEPLIKRSGDGGEQAVSQFIILRFFIFEEIVLNRNLLIYKQLKIP